MRIDLSALVEKLDERIARELPTPWPPGWQVHSKSVGDHLPWGGDASGLEKLPRDVAISFLTIAGDVFRVRFGRLPRGDPDRAWLAHELEPIPISEVVPGA